MNRLGELVHRRNTFMGSLDDYDSAKAVLIGAPMDWTVSFRPGSRFGPQSIRDVSDGIEEYSVYQDRSLEEAAFYDAGDLVLPFGNARGSLEMIGEVTRAVLGDGKLPVLLGGEHLVSLPAIVEASRKYPDLVLVHFDAHADLRSDYMGQTESHASVIRRVLETAGAGIEVHQLGIRSGTGDEFKVAGERTHLHKFEVVAPAEALADKVGGRPVYVTLDIDVVDPAFAPGTGTPEPAGCTSKEILQAVRAVSRLNLVGFDLVEVCPPYDQTQRTALLAALILRELLVRVASSQKRP